MTSRLFHIGDVLSVTTEMLVSLRKMDGLYDILGYMTGESLTALGLLTVCDACSAALVKQYPWLEFIKAPDLSEYTTDREKGFAVGLWLGKVMVAFGEELEITPLQESPYGKD